MSPIGYRIDKLNSNSQITRLIMLSTFYCIHHVVLLSPNRFSLFPDEDDEGERNTVPLTPLESFFSDNDSLKQQKKKKPKKMKEGKMPKVKKRKKEVRCNSF